jgi:hypothetical protein
MKKVTIILLAFMSISAFAQDLSKLDVINTVKKVADHVIKNTTYLYYNRATGDLISDLQKYGYNKNVVPQNIFQ